MTMQEDVEFTLPNHSIHLLVNNEDRANKLQDILSDHKGVRNLLSSYHKGAEITYDVRIDIKESGAGWLYFDYTVHIYSGCRDMDWDEEHDMEVQIDIDWTSGIVTLGGPNIPERDPDEY